MALRGVVKFLVVGLLECTVMYILLFTCLYIICHVPIIQFWVKHLVLKSEDIILITPDPCTDVTQYTHPTPDPVGGLKIS